MARKFPFSSSTAWAALFLGVFTLVFLKAPILEVGPLLMAIFGAVLGMVLLSFIGDPDERRVVGRLFFAAYALRLAFTYVFYKSGLEPSIGGADALAWKAAFYTAGQWTHALATGQPPPRVDPAFPNTFFDLFFNAKRNSGFNYGATWFYFLMPLRNQVTLAFFHSFAGSLVIVMVYQSSRLFASQRGALFAAGVAAVLPGFLIWGALTQKEVWVILCQITGFYAVWRACIEREGKLVVFYTFFSVAMVAALYALRFYAAYVQVLGALFTVCCANVRRPWRTTLVGGGTLLAILTLGLQLHFLKFDVSSLIEDQISEMKSFQTSMQSGPGQRESSVVLNYNIATPLGAAQMLVVGGAYLMFAPFLWQVSNFRQAAALPDVFVWYWLFFVFILPGAWGLARKRGAVPLSIAVYILPLLLAYALSFANVGLAFRQRAQLIPIMMTLAAVGYDRRREKREKSSKTQRLKAALALVALSRSQETAVRSQQPGEAVF